MQWFIRKLGDLSMEIIGGLILIGVVYAAARWAIDLLWAGPLIIVLVVGLVALGLFIVNQLHIIRQRRSAGFANMSNNRIEVTLREWLFHRGYKMRAVTLQSALFAFVVELQDRPVTIARLADTRTFITLLGAVEVSKEHQEVIGASPKVQRTRILQDLKIEMARYGINYEDIKDPLTKITLSHEILCDQSLTEEGFLRSVMFVNRGIILLRQLILREIATASNPDTEGS